MNRSEQTISTNLEPGQLTEAAAAELGQPYKALSIAVLLAQAGLEVAPSQISTWSAAQILDARTWAWNEVNGDKSPPPQFVVDAAAATRRGSGSMPLKPVLRINAMTADVIEARLKYVRPTPEHVATMNQLNEKILDLGRAIGELPEGMMKSKAVTDLVQLRMTINAAVIGDGIPAGSLANERPATSGA